MQVRSQECERLALEAAQAMTLCRVRATQAASAQQAAANAQAAAEAAQADAARTKQDAADLYDRWRLRADASEAAAGTAQAAVQAAEAAAAQASQDLAAAKTALRATESRLRDAQETITAQELRVAELEGRGSERTAREYDAQLAAVRRASRAQQTALQQQIDCLQQQLAERDATRAGPPLQHKDVQTAPSDYAALAERISTLTTQAEELRAQLTAERALRRAAEAELVAVAGRTAGHSAAEVERNPQQRHSDGQEWLPKHHQQLDEDSVHTLADVNGSPVPGVLGSLAFLPAAAAASPTPPPLTPIMLEGLAPELPLGDSPGATGNSITIPERSHAMEAQESLGLSGIGQQSAQWGASERLPGGDGSASSDAGSGVDVAEVLALLEAVAAADEARRASEGGGVPEAECGGGDTLAEPPPSLCTPEREDTPELQLQSAVDNSSVDTVHVPRASEPATRGDVTEDADCGVPTRAEMTGAGSDAAAPEQRYVDRQDAGSATSAKC